MKKSFAVFFLFCLFFSQVCFAVEGVHRDYSHSEDYSTQVPPLLQGIWQGKDRLLLFGGNNASFACVLRVFYQWYDDLSGADEQYAQISSRDKNNTVAVHPENILIEFKTIYENSSKNAGAFELKIKYPALKDYVYIPVAVVNGQIFLNFMLKSTFDNGSSFVLTDYSAASGITISPPVIKKELLSFLVNGDSFYSVRYWLSEMEESDALAEFIDDGKHFKMPKFIQLAGNLYTCTTGKSLKIRNVIKNEKPPYDFITDEDKIIYAYSDSYLTFVPGSSDYSQLNKIIKENNSKRHVQPSLFPVKESNYRWKEISDLEVYNPRTWNKRNLDIHK